jgi:hypothetical protein
MLHGVRVCKSASTSSGIIRVPEAMLGDCILKRGPVDPASTHPTVPGSIRVPKAMLGDSFLNRGSVGAASTLPT